MDGRRRGSAGAVLAVAAIGLGAAPAAMAASGVSVSAVSSLKGNAGTLSGKIVNDTGKLSHARVTISLHLRGTKRAVVIVDGDGIVRHRHDHRLGLDYLDVDQLSTALGDTPSTAERTPKAAAKPQSSPAA